MIAPDVRLVDLEPDGFALICRLALAAQLAQPRTVSVLHDSGVPVSAHDSTGARLDASWLAAFDDATRQATELRAAHAVERVVLYDRSRVDQLAAAVVANSTPATTQLEAFWANSDSFWSSPAIAVAPPPPANPWRHLPARLGRLGDDWWALLAMYDGDTCAATLLGHLAGGRVDTVTSLDTIGRDCERPSRQDAARIAELAAPLGRIELMLVCEAEALGEALCDPDPLHALAALEGDARTILSRNLHLLRS